MKSELERLILGWIARSRRAMLFYDRGVVWGALFALTPIFPACFLGMMISMVNVGLALSGRLDRKNRDIALVASCVGAFFSLVWWYVLASLSEVGIIEIIVSFLNHALKNFWQVPVDGSPKSFSDV